MNLRLRPDAEEALRIEAERSDRSQQDVLRAAVDRYLGIGAGRDVSQEDELITSGRVRPSRTPYRRVVPREDTASSVPTSELLDRDDRF